MKKLYCLSLIFLVCIFCLVNADEKVAEKQHKALGLLNKAVPKYQHTDHPEAQWFGEGNLGLFLHWGVSSVDADNEISWAMLKNLNWNPNPIAPTEYWAQAKEFDPNNYNPEKWIKAAKDAGFTYAVLTTRHHDGFAMWPSDYGDLDTDNYMGGRDLVRPFVEACRKHRMKVGLYFSGVNWRIERRYRSYSLTSDGTPNNPHLDVNYEPTELKPRDAELREKYREINSGQLKELLTNYGEIDLIFFDSGTAFIPEEKIREWQPGIIINNRVSDLSPDYDSSFEGGRLPEEKPAGWWEACQTAVGSWGYQEKYDDYAMSAKDILSQFIKIRAWGGSYLINFAPRADGTLPEIYYERMEEIEKWMEGKNDALFGTEAGPYPEQCNVPVTTRDRKWYLFVLPEFKGDKVILKGVPKPGKVTFNGEVIDYNFDETRVEIPLTKDKRTEMPDVIKVEW